MATQTDHAAQSSSAPTSAAQRPLAALEIALLAALAYLPQLLVDRGVESSDTKTYLYLDLSRFLRQITAMWDPSVAMGTVTHQYVGYLFPMGPFFWVLHGIGVPVWVAQRLWLGTLLFAAGLGVRYLTTNLGLRAPARTIAAVAYMCTPFVLEYAGRESILLLPWAALPWLIALIALAIQGDSWRYPALFALVIALSSSANASTIFYVALGPMLWLVYAPLAGETTWRRSAKGALRAGILSLGVCVWWIVGVGIEGAYGVNILKYTETVVVTTSASNPVDVLRGLGYWYFYGSDRDGVWTNAALLYTQSGRVVALSFFAPLAAVLGAAFTRWRHRAFFLLLAVAGLVLSVGANPLDSPTPFGQAARSFMTTSSLGLALRSSDRATPLLVLGLAVLLGAGLAALGARWRRLGLLAAGGVGVVLLVASPALFNGDTIAHGFTQPATLPTGQLQALHYLNQIGGSTRVLGLPGNDFASYLWGDTVDTPQSALLKRPYATHEQQVMGSLATSQFLYAVDNPIQEMIADPNALAPMARLASAGNLFVQYDSNYLRYNQVHPQQLARLFTPTPLGLSDPISFGTLSSPLTSPQTVAEPDLALLSEAPLPEATVFTVSNPRPVTRAESNTGALLIAGDNIGLNDLAGTGLLNTTSALYFSGTLATQPARIRSLAAQGANLLLTDSNRKQGFRWTAISGVAGATETAAENPAATDVSDSPVELFPQAGLGSKTLVTYLGIRSVTASSYGPSDVFAPEHRAYAALDANPATSWQTGIGINQAGQFWSPVGQWWQVTLNEPATIDHLTLTQPLTGNVQQHLTSVRLVFDGRTSIPVDLTNASRQAGGQLISFPSVSFETLRIVLTGVTPGADTGVGFSEVGIPGHQATEVLAMPSDLLGTVGHASLANRLTVEMSRWRTSPFPPRSDAETSISRTFALPTARSFALSGNATISALLPDPQIDALVGRTGSVVASSSSRLTGSLTSTASATLDGNPATAWQPALGDAAQVGAWLQYDLAAPLTMSHLELSLVTDGRHSVPEQVTISSLDGTRTVTLPVLADATAAGSTTTVPLDFTPLSGTSFRLTFDKVRFIRNQDLYGPSLHALPLGIAEVQLPGVAPLRTPAALPGTCTGSLLEVDGRAISVALVGTTADALAGRAVQVAPCGSSSGGIELSAGHHLVVTALGNQPSTGWDLDQLVLDSAPGGTTGAAPGSNGLLAATQPGPTPSLVVTSTSTTAQQAKLHGVSQPFELVLGQSVNPGWRATLSAGGHSVDLGASQLVDGFANGWLVDATTLHALGVTPGHPLEVAVSLRWTPQRLMNFAYGISLAALLACLVLALRRRRRPATDGLGEVDLAETPRLELPLCGRGSRVATWFVVTLSAALGATGWLLAGAGAGLVVLVAVAATLRWPRLRGALGLLGAIVLSGAAFSVVFAELQHRYGFNGWTANFQGQGRWVLFGIVLLIAEAVLEVVERRQTQDG